MIELAGMVFGFVPDFIGKVDSTLLEGELDSILGLASTLLGVRIGSKVWVGTVMLDVELGTTVALTTRLFDVEVGWIVEVTKTMLDFVSVSVSGIVMVVRIELAGRVSNPVKIAVAVISETLVEVKVINVGAPGFVFELAEDAVLIKAEVEVIVGRKPGGGRLPQTAVNALSKARIRSSAFIHSQLTCQRMYRLLHCQHSSQTGTDQSGRVRS